MSFLCRHSSFRLLSSLASVRIVPFNSNDLPPLLLLMRLKTWKLKIVSNIAAAFWACKNVIYLVCNSITKTRTFFFWNLKIIGFLVSCCCIWNDSIVLYDCVLLGPYSPAFLWIRSVMAQKMPHSLISEHGFSTLFVKLFLFFKTVVHWKHWK